jgi:hypothetical protein
MKLPIVISLVLAFYGVAQAQQASLKRGQLEGTTKVFGSPPPIRSCSGHCSAGKAYYDDRRLKSKRGQIPY